MANGYAGKIARLNLSTKEITRIDTEKYEQFGGGFGIGAAIFWDLAVAPGEWDMKNAYDPQNVIVLMSGPLAATGVPGAGRMSVCGLSRKVKKLGRPATEPFFDGWSWQRCAISVDSDGAGHRFPAVAEHNIRFSAL